MPNPTPPSTLPARPGPNRSPMHDAGDAPPQVSHLGGRELRVRSPAAADGEWIAQASPGSSQEDAFLPRIFSEDGAKSRQLDSATKTDCAPAKTLLDWLSIQLLVEPEYYTDCLALLKEGLEKHPHVDPENFIEFLESQHPGLKLPALAGGLTGIVSLLLWHETLRALARAGAYRGQPE